MVQLVMIDFMLLFEGVSLEQAKKSNCTDLFVGAAPMPREMSFPLGASENWNNVYDFIRYKMLVHITEISQTL